MEGYRNIYFIGIGGIGMSALARYFRSTGCNVAGYDRTATPLTRELESLDIQIHYEDSLEKIPAKYKDPLVTLVIYTPAIPQSHRELQFFRSAGFEIKKRAEILADITRDTFCFAVAGTHGKTTTSSILAHLLVETETPVTAFLGGISEDFGSNYVNKGNGYTVVEADEFDRSFLYLSPDVACITSMDADHLDIYGSALSLKEAFQAFAEKLKPGGKLFVRNGLPISGITYGIEDGSDYCIENIKVDRGTYVFDLRTPTETIGGVRFGKPGRHNLLNGLAAFAMAEQAGPTPEKLANALATFKGVDRRFSYRIKKEGFVFIDDYAHHPTEIDAVHNALEEMHPEGNVLAVFQPHLYSRTKDFGKEFAASLAKFDSILLLDIYPARELPIPGIDSQWILDQIENPRKKLIDKSELVKEIKLQNPDILVVMGAGDIGLEVKRIKSEIEHAD